MSILYAEIKTTKKNLNDRKICMNLDLTTRAVDMASFVCVLPIFERPTRRSISISPSITTEGKKAHKPGDRAPCCAAGYLDRRQAAWLLMSLPPSPK